MKKTNLLLVCLAIALSSALFFACKKENPISTSSAQVESATQPFKGITFKDDMLVFENDSYIEILVNTMHDNLTATNKRLLAQFPAFKSNKVAFDDFKLNNDFEKLDMSVIHHNENLVTMVGNVGALEVAPTIDSETLSSITNVDGYFQVGTTLYKVTRDIVYQYDAVSKREIKQDKVTRNSIQSKISTERDTYVYKQYFCNKGNSAEENKFIKCTLIYTSYGVYSEVGMATSSLKERWWGFADLKVQFIKVSGTYTIERYSVLNSPFEPNQKPCSTTTFNGTLSKTNAADVRIYGSQCWSCCNALVPINAHIQSYLTDECGNTVTANIDF